MRILFISRWFPYPADNGAKIRILNLIKQLSLYAKVDLVSFASEQPTEDQVNVLERFCGEVVFQIYQPFNKRNFKALLGFFSPLPRSAIATRSDGLQNAINRLVGAHSYDFVIASQIDMAPYAINLHGPIKILEELELTILFEQFSKQKKPILKFRNGLTWLKLSNYVSHLLDSFDGCTVASDLELEIVRKLAKPEYPISVIPNGVDNKIYTNGRYRPVPGTIIFSGSLTYRANFQAVRFFLFEIFPLICEQIPDAKFIVTGSLDGVDIQSFPKYPGVTFTGHIEDIHKLITESWLSVVPIQVGGGTRLKILEAMALGTPVISTSKGAEGLLVENGKDILIADEPRDFARAVIDLLGNPLERDHLSERARETVTQLYDWEKIGIVYKEYLDRLSDQNPTTLSNSNTSRD
jgi:polysaccharide biosynthesis protein PslH